VGVGIKLSTIFVGAIAFLSMIATASASPVNITATWSVGGSPVTMVDFGTVFTGSHNSIIVQLILQANGTLDSFTDDGTSLVPQEDIDFSFKPISFDYEQDGPDGSTATYQTEVNWDPTSNGPGQATLIQAYSADYADPEASISIIGTSVTETPLPSALPLFATGLGLLGLLDWRRKRKKATLAAA
jgi:hypothetical protein